MKTSLSKTLTVESGRTIELLEKISELLKYQRRHFDDAVVIHCICLIHEYVEDNLRGFDPSRANGSNTDQRS